MTGIASEAHEGAAAQPRRWTGRTRGGLVGNWIFVTLIRACGLRSAYALLVFVSFYYLFFAPKAARASLDYRRRLGLGSSRLSGWWWAWRHFFAFGQLLLDRVAIVGGATAKLRLEVDGREHLFSALKEGRGAVLVTAHTGNWAAAAHLLASAGIPVNLVAYEGEAAYIRRMFDKALKGKAFSLIQVDGSPDAVFEIRAALCRGEIVAMNGDRVFGARAVTLPLLGTPASFPTGPYMVAALNGAPLVHAFGMREATNHYHVYACPAEHLVFEPAAREALIGQAAARFVAHLEEMLRRYPLQWHNFYDFWGADAN